MTIHVCWPMLEKEGPKAGGCDTADPFFVGASFQKAEHLFERKGLAVERVVAKSILLCIYVQAHLHFVCEKFYGFLGRLFSF